MVLSLAEEGVVNHICLLEVGKGLVALVPFEVELSEIHVHVGGLHMVGSQCLDAH